MRFLFMLAIITSSISQSATIYNGETAKFSAASVWDQNGSSLVESNSSSYSAPNHLKLNIIQKNWWGAVAYVPANWSSIDLSKSTAIKMAIRSSNLKKISVSLFDGSNKTSSKVDVNITNCYLQASLPIASMTGVDLTTIKAIVFSVSNSSTPSVYIINIDNIETVESATPVPLPTPTPTTPVPPTPTSVPLPTPTPTTGDIESVRVKAASLAYQLTGKNNMIIGEGGVNPKALNLNPGVHYRYLVGYGSSGWRGWNSPDGEYATIVINQAKEVNAIPMFTIYQLALEYENKNYAAMTSNSLHQWLLDMRVLLQKIALGGFPTIVHLEPDFTGYLQQYAVSLGVAAGSIQAKVKASDLPECNNVSENVSGMFQCVFNMSKAIAPKTKIGLHASAWGDWYDPMNPYNVVEKGTSVGRFLMSLGVDPDFIVIDPCDRDAGFWEVQGRKNVYWDESNTVEPKFSTFFIWKRSVAIAANKPILWWQIPFGVPSTTAGGTDGHYRDNRVRYLFNHLNDVAAYGGFGLAFGAGADRQTTPSTDGGQFKTSLDKYNLAPLDLTKR